MKHLIIAAIVLISVGVQPTSAPTLEPQSMQNEQILKVSPIDEANQALSAPEMATIVGGDNLTGCWDYVDATGDLHIICCLDLWIFSICVDTNVGQIERWIGELF
jgi:hypothetical protein